MELLIFLGTASFVAGLVCLYMGRLRKALLIVLDNLKRAGIEPTGGRLSQGIVYDANNPRRIIGDSAPNETWFTSLK